RPPIAGIPELRRWFAGELSHTDSSGSAPAESWHSADVMVASGGQAALAAAFRALAAPGEAIVMESPTYWGAIGAARQAGLVIVPVPRSDGAPRADDLDAALTSSGARVFYAQPNHANPTGDRWDAGQRSAILDVITAHRAFLVEDDWAHDLGIDEPVRPLAVADRDGHVVYVRSLTKSMSPSMRVAGILARGPARVRIEQALAHSDLFVSPILQWAALDVVSRPAWRTHRKTLARALGDRRDALLAALRGAGFDPRRPAGGLHLWVDLGVGRAGDALPDADTVVARALTKGLAISPGAEWFPAEPTGLFVRLTYSAVTPDRYDDAVRILSESL
ncbi:PLP-dependent aminotransferase family protein, partial [Gordonia sp. i37]|uniref:aminotransferase-like domain-containing protein n=1 Tax=Gordonia sp. i37 TaxID=1961707 RepID=UPI0009AED3FF